MPWLVAQTESQREAVALRWLTEQRYEPYLPQIRVKRYWAGRVVEGLEPLFRGYLFVKAVAVWQPILRAIGIIDLLHAGDGPAQLDDAVLAEIRARERDGVVVLPGPPRLKRGDPCRVIRGSLLGRRGIYQGMRPKQRERALLDLLGRLVVVDFPRGDLEAIR